MSLRAKFLRELAALGLPASPGVGCDLAVVSEADLAPLPQAAQRYLRFMHVLGRPRDWSFRLGLSGRFRRSQSEPWMKCDAWQYNTRVQLARIFYLQIRFFGVVSVLGRDTYVDGRGRMLIRALDLFTVGDGVGEPYDVGELVTYLNDGILIAPSMLLVPQVRWSEGDAGSFNVELTDHQRTVKARVFVNEEGAPVSFETTDRFYSDPKDATKATRCRWTTPVEGWQDVGERRLPTRGQAVWHLPQGELAYADFAFEAQTLAFNVAPGALR